MKPILCLVLAATAVAQAQQPPPDPLETLLSRTSLDEKQPLIEMQAYTASRVPVMPTFKIRADWQTYADQLRNDVLNKVVLRGEAGNWAKTPLKVEWADVIQGQGYKIRKLRFEAVPGFWLPALLYEPDRWTPKPPSSST